MSFYVTFPTNGKGSQGLGKTLHNSFMSGIDRDMMHLMYMMVFRQCVWRFGIAFSISRL